MSETCNFNPIITICYLIWVGYYLWQYNLGLIQCGGFIITKRKKIGFRPLSLFEKTIKMYYCEANDLKE